MFYPVKKKSGVAYADPFDHIFEQFFGDASRCGMARARLTPQFEITETDGEFAIAAELPGIANDHVEIVVDEDVLTIRGEKKAESKVEEKSYLFSERRYGSFERSFLLPETVKQEAIAATYEHGVLSLVLPKKAKAKKPAARQIKVK